MPPKIPYVKLSNGVDFPLFGLGTFLRAGPIKDFKSPVPEEAANELKHALDVAYDAGYRYLDTAQLYGNECVIGAWLETNIKSGKFKREDIFITTKLSALKHRPEDAAQAIDESLKDLKSEYIDLFLIHSPFPMESANYTNPNESKPLLVPHIETWRVLEKYYKMGKLRSIGISNFNERQVRELYDQAEIKPMNIQVECHIALPQNDLFEFCKKLGITLTSYSTIGSMGRQNRDPSEPNLLEVPLVVELAKNYNKTPAQILLRQMVQRGISVIPKSVTPERIRQNIDIFDFELTKDEMEQFNKLKMNKRMFPMLVAKNHPWYPW